MLAAAVGSVQLSAAAAAAVGGPRVARAAAAGIAAAQYEYGVALINGDGVEPGQVVAGARWLKRAAAQGHADAISDLATLSQDAAWAEVERELEASAADEQGAVATVGEWVVKDEV